MYYPAIMRTTTIDPLAEKYYHISPYAWCGNNPVNRVDPDGREIKFSVQNNGRNVILTYSNGNFWHTNGARYDPGNEKLSKTLYSTLAGYRAILNSGDKVLINKLKALENSKNIHWVQESKIGKNSVSIFSKNTMSEDSKLVKSGQGLGTQTYYNFSDKVKNELEEIQGVPTSNLSIITHEMQHQFNYDTGKMKDAHENSSASDPAEKRAVNNENRARKIENLPRRTTYGKKEIEGLD